MTTPTPPPAPTAKDGQAVLDAEYRDVKRRRREQKRRAWERKARSINPSYWKALGCVAVLAAGLWWWRGYAEQQRETDLTIAALAARSAVPATSVPAPPDPFPNPLLELGLSNQATWMVGVDPATGELWPARSAFVVAELLRTLDLCQTYIGVDPAGVLFIAAEPLPGSVPLVVCEAPPTVTSTTTVGGQ